MIRKFCQEFSNRNFSVAIVWINGGGNMDNMNKKGMNHILSSLLGRGCEGFNNFEISEYIYSLGGELNQEIFEDGILICLKSLNENFDKLYPLIDLIINKPNLNKKQFEYVKKSILYSIKKDQENPFNIVYEKWRKLVYLNHSYAFNCIGYESDILNISYEEILSEYENFKNRDMYLISNNTRIDYKNSTRTNQKFNNEKFFYKSLNSKNVNRLVNTYRNSNQIIMMLGNKTCSRFSDEYLPLKILESYLSFGMTSCLFKLFREKNGLTYDVGVFNPVRSQKTPFLIYLSVSNMNAIIAFEILLKLWRKLQIYLIKDDELELAKQKLKSSFLISNQSLEEILRRKIQMISYNQRIDFEKDFFKKIDKVNSVEIFEIFNKYFSKPYLSIFGNKKICGEIHNKWITNF